MKMTAKVTPMDQGVAINSTSERKKEGWKIFFQNIYEVNERMKSFTLFLTDEARFKTSFGFNHLIICVTMFVLFGDDTRILFFDKDADPVFMVLTSMSFFIFLLELLIFAWSKYSYRFGFYFWLDMLACVSLIPEIPWMSKLLGLEWVSLGASSTVGATAKLGRVGRMVRLVRLVKLYKASKTIHTDITPSKDVDKHLTLSLDEAKDEDIEVFGKVLNGKEKRFRDRERKLLNDLELVKLGKLSPDEYLKRHNDEVTSTEHTSKLGSQLSNTTTKHVISLVLVMLCSIPLLSHSVTNHGPHDTMALLQSFNERHDTWNLMIAISEANSLLEMTVPYITSKSQPNLVYLEVYPYYSNLSTIGCVESSSTWTSDNFKSTSATSDMSQLSSSICVQKKRWVGGGEGDRAVQVVNDVSQSHGAKLRPAEILGEEGKNELDGGVIYSPSCCYEHLINHHSNGSSYCAGTSGPCYIRYKFNIKVEMMDSAALNIMTTIFIALMLVIGSMVFIYDTDRNVLEPLHQITNMVERMAQDHSTDMNGNVLKKGQFEFDIIRATIIKIIALLKIGFGEAGFEMIRQNLERDVANTENTKKNKVTIDLLSNPGHPVIAVFGFCVIEVFSTIYLINNFDFLSRELKGDIMECINDVASVVHENVEEWSGHCNKNLGNSFLMTWKVPENEYAFESATKLDEKDISRNPKVMALAEQALIGISKVVENLNRDSKLMTYRNRPELQRVDQHGGVIPFKIRMKFGLHIGWAIEGPVGSLHKVDATYLSPHVNIAARCATAAKQWNVDILCTDKFVGCLSDRSKHFMRHIDRVSVKGSACSLNMYTLDVFHDQNMPSSKQSSGRKLKRSESMMSDRIAEFWKSFPPGIAKWNKNYVAKMNRHITCSNNTDLMSPTGFFDYTKYAIRDVHGVFKESIESEVNGFDVKFHHMKGVEKYLQGHWRKATLILTVVDRVVGARIRAICIEEGLTDLTHVSNGMIGDGPSRALIEFMARTDFQPPHNWSTRDGRKLMSK